MALPLFVKCRSSRRALCLFIAFFLVHCYPGPPYFPPIRAEQYWATIGTGFGTNRIVETPFSKLPTAIEIVPKMAKMPLIWKASSNTRKGADFLPLSADWRMIWALPLPMSLSATNSVIPTVGHHYNVPSNGPKWKQMASADGLENVTVTPHVTVVSTVPTVSVDGAVLDEPRTFGGTTSTAARPWANSEQKVL
ncbi:hypothetical protein niasHT_005744 [Heterodera trifolii]|uniref:Secreted protein n=1 Tax=Heterodera trifolii TaxID=157864 RepID=A0ABD2LYV5_9BILA